MTGDLIFAYTRAEALTDGMLVAVPPTLADQAGFTVPVALTAGAWDAAVEVPPHLTGLQDETGRLWDVLNVLRVAIRASGDADDRVGFRVLVFDGAAHRPVNLYAVIGPGDDGEAVMTVLLEDED